MKPEPCKICKTAEHLKAKCNGPGLLWVMCDKCGNHSEPASSPQKATANWNAENRRNEANG